MARPDNEEKTEKKQHTPLGDADRAQRGRALDQMQERLHAMQSAGKNIPDEWREKTKKLAEAESREDVAAVTLWIETELPPKEYVTAEITWDTYTQFANELLHKLTVHVSCMEMITGEKNTGLISIMKEIHSLKSATNSPVVAMAELAKLRARAITLSETLQGVV